MEHIDISGNEMKSIGGVLLLARTEAGLSQDDIAGKLYLSKSFVEHIENDEFDKLDQTPIFIRGYIRSYAKLVNIAETKIVDLLDRTGVLKSERHAPKKITTQKQLTLQDKNMRFATYAIVIVILSCVFAWWHSKVTQRTTQLLPAVTQQSNMSAQPSSVTDDNKSITAKLHMDTGKT